MKSYIGYSIDSTIRYKASSGGVGSAIVKYLLDNGQCDYALSFEWDKLNLCYQPIFISDFSQYNICGSIYQEINIIDCVKNFLNTCNRGDKIVLFCLPCQTRALRHICDRAGLDTIIIGLTCSSQQSKDASLYLLNQIGINENDVVDLRYRGNGWPGGVSITTNNGTHFFIKNNNSIWRDIFHSKLFIQHRCFMCNNTLNTYADISLADPWLKHYVENEKLGQTLFTSFTSKGEQLIQDCLNNNYINAIEVDSDLLYRSQIRTINRKEAYTTHPNLTKRMRAVFLSDKYKRLAETPFLFKLHCLLLSKIEKMIIK